VKLPENPSKKQKWAFVRSYIKKNPSILVNDLLSSNFNSTGQGNNTLEGEDVAQEVDIVDMSRLNESLFDD
jgi:hypothetical protein